MAKNKLDKVKALIGLECWNVSLVGDYMSLTFGDRIKRSVPLKNPTVSNEYRDYTGELNLYIWCYWEIGGNNKTLAGRKVRDVSILNYADLTLTFDDGTTLLITCNDDLPSDWDSWEMVDCKDKEILNSR